MTKASVTQAKKLVCGYSPDGCEGLLVVAVKLFQSQSLRCLETAVTPWSPLVSREKRDIICNRQHKFIHTIVFPCVCGILYLFFTCYIITCCICWNCCCPLHQLCLGKEILISVGLFTRLNKG